MSVTVIGNTKYNETQQHILAVGSGNDLSSNVYNAVVFGDDNTLNSAGESVIIMANSASITDSNFVTLIQPSGSRSVSGSSNNVILNPISDIVGNDPTGSVYTGNLINQGTADFKNGATITGSLVVNGVTISSGSNVPTLTNFNFAFGTDPNNTIFVTIPNATGINRAFNLRYILTSGSTAINAGQLQLTADGTAATAEVILQRNLAGAPTASFTAVYNLNDLDVRTSFIGSNYIMSGSYNSFI